MELALACILGTLFGFVLHRISASDPQFIIDMLRLKDLHLMKTILFGIGVSSAILFLGMVSGIIDAGHLSVKASTLGVIAGGALLGVGWAVAGFCPGTGLVALGSGRKDAIAFVAGGLAGALAYALSYSTVKSTGLLESIIGGKTTLVTTGNDAYEAVLAQLPGAATGFVLAVCFMLVGWFLPRYPGQPSQHHPSDVSGTTNSGLA